MTTRLQTVREAFERRFAPKRLPPPPAGSSVVGIAAHVIRNTPRDSQRVGGMSKLFYALPKEEQSRVISLVRNVNDERDMGRHGDPDGYLKGRGVDKGDIELVHRVTDGFNQDRLVYELGERMGTDAKRPMPELTRADVISAAIDAHS